MATDADIVIPIPVCEARVEQLVNVVDTIVKISVSEVPQENQDQDDKHNELPMIKGEDFLKSPLTNEVRSEANGVTPDASKVVESAEESQQNVEVSNNKDDEEDRGVVPEEKCSMVSSVAVAPEMKVGDTIDAHHKDDAAGVTQVSKETNNDHHGTENVALANEILLESSLMSKETESHTPCISESEKMDIQSKSIENERSVEHDLNTTAEKESHEEISPQETITTLETSNGDKLESKSELNTPLYEEETIAQKGDKSVTASEDHGDVECQSQTSEDVATGHNDPKRVEKFEESPPVQVEDLQIERDEHFEDESERLPLTEVSTEGPVDNAAHEAMDNVKDGDKDSKEVELSEDEQNTSTLVKEVVHTENLAESSHESPENIEVSDLSQEDSINAPPEKQSINVTLHGDTIKANEATINADDQHKESLEIFPTIALSSPEGPSMNAVLHEDTNVHTDEKIIEEVDNHKEVLEKTYETSKDGLDTLVERPVELAKNEDISAKENQRSTEESNNTDKYGNIDAVSEVCSADSTVVISEIKVGDTLVDPDIGTAKVVTQLSQDTSSDHQGTNDCFTEDAALKEEILQKTESHTPCISEGSKDKESNIPVITTDNKSVDEKPTEEDILCNLTNEVSKEGESDVNKKTSEQEELENNKSVENSTSGEAIIALETSNSDELRSKSDLNSSLPNEVETAVQKTLEDAATDYSGTKVTEKSEEISAVPVEDSQIDHSEHLEEESEGLPLTEASTWGTNDNVSADVDTGEVKEQDEDHREAKLSENEQSTKCTSVTEDVQTENTTESLHMPLENIEVSNISQQNSTIKPEEATIDATEEQKDSRECFLPIVSGSPKEETMNEVIQEVSSEYQDKKIIDEVDKHKEVSENLFSTEDAEGNSLVELEGSETKKEDDSKKESDETPLALEVSDASTLLHEARAEDGEPKKAEFCVDEMDVESMSPKTESITEGDMHLDSELTKVPDSVDKISEGGTVDAEAEKEENVEDAEPSGEELFEKNENTESVLLAEVQSKKAVESLHAALEDIKTSDFDQCTEVTGILEEQIPAENSQGMPSDETGIDAANTQELQNVSNEDSGKALLIKVADSELTRDINLEEELETLSLIETSKDEASDNESILLEPKPSDEFASKVELLNDEKSTDCTTPKKESLQPQDHKTSTSSAARELTCSLEEQSLGENSQTIISDKLIDASAAEKHDLTLENVATETPHEHIEENAVTQVDSSAGKHEERMEEDNQSSSLIEAPAEETDVMESKNIDESKICEESIKPDLENGENTESIYVKKESDVETPIDSLQVKPDDVKQHDSVSDINESIEEETSNSDPQEISTNKVGKSVDATHANEENVETKVNNMARLETTHLGQEREISSPNEQRPLEGIKDDNTEEIADSETILEVETNHENYAATPDEDTKEDSRDQADNLVLEQEEHSEKDSESTSLSDAPKDEITGSTLVKEVAEVEDPIDSSEVATEDIKAFAPCQVTEISSTVDQIIDTKDISSNKITEKTVDASDEDTQEAQDIAKSVPREYDSPNEQNTEAILKKEDVSIGLPRIVGDETSSVQEEEKVEIPTEEQTLTATPQGICDKTEEITVDAANNNNDLVISVPNGDSEDDSPIEVDGLQEPFSKEVPAKKSNDDEPTTSHEVEFANENTAKANLNENEEKLECSLVKEEAHIESLQVADKDVKDTSSGQDRKPSHLEEQGSTKDSHETMGDERYAKSFDSTDLKKQETLADENYAATTDEDTKEDSRNHVDYLLMEREEHSVKDSVSTSVSDAPKDDIRGSTLATEVAEVEDPIDSSQVATEDIKAFAPSQDTKTSSSVEQITDSKDISSNKIMEKTVDATGEESQEAQNIAKSVPREDDSPNKQNTEPTLMKEDQSIELPQIVAEDIKEPCSSEIREANAQEEQIPCASSGVVINDNKEKTTIDPTIFKNETLKNEVPEVSEEAVEKAPEEVKEKICANEAIERILHQEELETSIEEPTTKIDCENPHNLDIACVETDTQDSSKEVVQTTIIPEGENEEHNKEDEICSSDKLQEHLILSEGKSKEEANKTYKEACVEAEQFDLSSQTKDISECAISDVGQETLEENEKYAAEKSYEEDDPKQITECEVSSASEDIKLTEQSSEDASITTEVLEAKAGTDLGAAVPVPEATRIESQEVEELNDKCTEMADTSTPNETSVVTAPKNIGESAEGAPLEAEDQPTTDIALTEQLSEGAFITAEVQEEKDGIYLGAAVPVPEATGSECQEVEELYDKCTKMADTSATVENSEISTLNSIGESTERTKVEAKDQQAKLRDFPEESNMRHTEVKMAGIDDAVNLQSVGDTGEDVLDQEFCKESFGMSNNQNPVKGDPEERSETSEGKEANPIQAAPASESLEQEIEEQKPGRDTEDVHEEDTNISNIPNQLESVCGADTAKLPESSNYESSVENTDQCDRSVNCSQEEQNESENIPSLEAPAVSCTESSPVKEEEKVEIPTGEQILTANPQGTDETREKTVDAANENNDVVISIPNGDNEDNSSIKVDGLQEHFPEEVPAEKINDDEPTTAHGVEFANENAVKANLTENEKKPECSHVNEEVYTESMQVADEDVTDTSSGQDRKSRHLEEQASTEDSHETIGDEGYAKTFDSTGLKQETLEDEVRIITNYAANPDEDTKEDTRDQVGGLLLEQEEHSEKESESTSLSDGPKVDITESMLVKEVAEVEDAIDTSQVATEDIKIFDPCQDIEISSTVEQITDSKDISSNKITEKTVDATGKESQEAQDIAKSVPREYDSPDEQNTEAILIKENESIELPRIVAEGRIPVQEEEKMEIPTEEQILTVNPQGTCDVTQEIAVDAANKDNDVVISIPNGDNEDNSPIEVGGLQEPFSEEVPAEKINDAEPTTTHEVEFANENTVKVNLNENEEKLECPHVNEEVYIESLQVVDEDVKDTSSSQDRKPSHLEEQASTKGSHETMGDERYAKSFDSTDLEQETLEDEARIIVNYAPTTDEDTKEDSRSQVDDLLMEQEEHSVKDSESTSVSYAPKDNITESTLVKEVAEVDDPIGTEIVTGDIKAFSPCQDTELGSTVEKITDSKDILSNNITEKTADATGEETQEAQDIAKSVPREDDSPNEQDTEATLMKEELSIESPRIAAEDIEPCTSKIRETNSQEEQIPCASPGVVINDNEEKKTTDPTIFENKIPKNEERSLNLTAEETPCKEDMNVNKVIIDHIPEVTDDKQQDSPVKKVPEENIMQSNEHVLDGNSMGSGVSEKISDQVDGEANSCGDKMDLEKIEVLNDGPLAVPTSETLAEIESRGCTETEVQVPKGEKEAEFKREAENDQKNIDTTLPDYAASENVSELKEVNGKEEIASNNCAEILSSPISVASEEVSTSNVALEEDSTYNTVTHLETKNVQEASAIKETTPSSAGQDAESISVEENYVCSSTKEESHSNEVAFIPGENKSGLESNTGLESISQGQHCDIISKTEEEDLKAEAELQSDKAVTEEILQEETTSKKETMKEDISREKEQLPRIKEEHEDIKDYHQGSYEVEVIKDSHQEDDVMKDQHINSKETYDFIKHGNNAETVPKVSEEADEKASEEVKEKIFANEVIERILHQEEQETSIEEPTAKIDIACVNTGTQELNKEAVQTTIIPGGESEEHNKEDKMCSSDEVQEHLIFSEGKSKEAKETYKEACVEAEQFDLSSQTKDISECAIGDVGQDTPEENEKYITEKSSGEDDPKTITECEVSSASEDIKLTEQSLEDASITTEVQEAKSGIDLGVSVLVPEATVIKRQEVEELKDKCTEMTDASTPDETSVMTASKTIGESTEGAPLEAKDQQTKDTALTEQLSEGACITTEVQEAKDGIYLGADVPFPEATGSEERTDTDGKEANPIQAAPVSETPEQEIEEQKLGRDTADVHEEEKHISNIPNQLESVCVADTEKVPESSIHQSSAENTGQCDKKEGNQHIDSPLALPHAQCSDIKTFENEPQYVGGLANADVTELEALKDKHVVLEADDTRYLILENQDGDKNISTEYSQGEHEVERPSKVEKEREECGNEERKDQQIEGKPGSEETDKPSLSDLLQVSTRGTSEMADHSPTEKEPTNHTEDMHAENTGEVEHEQVKTDEEKDDEDESHEPKSDLGSEAPVMVDTGDTDMKVAHKKSHNILSGVGSKVKHSIAKVKKAITGKSPKKVTTPESK
ncbi:biorientation of chromosomes in cell division protein 1-like 1 isoform X4 [Salvia hispanica]|uniref:biorientation of chromosomes in cell division protein 1-like 1 isoform X4 n=1 Tax=Salvia hispanica TaxID=49212 RepID=UPI0020097800|nr:biorientation of chromosomes in cell division protein 1-like 1 isoform X4 [Salvia hispanica]